MRHLIQGHKINVRENIVSSSFAGPGIILNLQSIRTSCVWPTQEYNNNEWAAL